MHIKFIGNASDRESTQVTNCRLPKLSPEGIGTPLAEANSSYLTRLSEALSVTAGTLLADLIFPTVGLLTLAASLKRGSTRILSAPIFNGTSNLTIKIISALEQLTMHDNLAYLTLLPLKGLLIGQNVFRLNKAWCPLCLEERRSNHLPFYDAMIWLLKLIKVCPVHHTPLRFQCPRCRCTLPVLIPLARSGFCSRCGQWLGSWDPPPRRINSRLTFFNTLAP
jgi:hypothetical protein